MKSEVANKIACFLTRKSIAPVVPRSMLTTSCIADDCCNVHLQASSSTSIRTLLVWLLQFTVD